MTTSFIFVFTVAIETVTLSCHVVKAGLKKKLYCMIQFANKENLSWSSHCLSFYQFFSIQKKFC